MPKNYKSNPNLINNSHELRKKRTKYLESCGIKVLRFLNKDINHNFENSCAYIDLNVKQRLG